MRRFLLVAVMCGAASVAQAADMPDLPFLRGSFTEGLSSARVNWQGFYVGGQASYGSSDVEVRRLRQRPARDLLNRPSSSAIQRLAMAIAAQGPQQHAPALAAFVGYNSQWDDVVVGIEANYIHDEFGRRLRCDRGAVITPTSRIRQPDPFERDREALRFRLAARPRRLRHGDASCPMCLPALGFGKPDIDRSTVLTAVIPYTGPFRRWRHRPPASKTKPGLRLQRRRSAST